MSLWDRGIAYCSLKNPKQHIKLYLQKKERKKKAFLISLNVAPTQSAGSLVPEAPSGVEEEQRTGALRLLSQAQACGERWPRGRS